MPFERRTFLFVLFLHKSLFRELQFWSAGTSIWNTHADILEYGIVLGVSILNTHANNLECGIVSGVAILQCESCSFGIREFLLADIWECVIVSVVAILNERFRNCNFEFGNCHLE